MILCWLVILVAVLFAIIAAGQRSRNTSRSNPGSALPLKSEPSEKKIPPSSPLSTDVSNAEPSAATAAKTIQWVTTPDEDEEVNEITYCAEKGPNGEPTGPAPEPDSRPIAPATVGQYNERAEYITIDQAAFIMQEPVKKLMKYINGGLMLCYKPSLNGDGPVMIHQSEMDRFKHPWKHIWRIDARLNDIQKRYEKIQGMLGPNCVGQEEFGRLGAYVHRLEENLEELRDKLESQNRKERTNGSGTTRKRKALRKSPGRRLPSFLEEPGRVS